MTTTLAIVIVSWNARDDLHRCLQSLEAAPPAIPHEIVVVDNASSDGAPVLVREQHPGVRLLEAPGNVGFARANNIGIRATRSDLVLLLNPDTVVPPGAIDALAAELAQNPAAAAVAPRLVDGEGVPELSFGPHPSVVGQIGQMALGRLHARGTRVARSAVACATSSPRRVAWASGACLLVRRVDAEAVGLLDERYFLYWEDVDFCLALGARGRDVRFTPSCTVVHRRGRSGSAAAGAAAEAYRRAQLTFYSKHLRGWRPWLRAYLWITGRLPAGA